MEFFSPCQLSDTGTLVTSPGEIEHLSLENVSILTHDKRPTTFTSGLITITTHRVVWVDRARRSAVAAHLQHLPANAVETKASVFSTTRATLRFGLGVQILFLSRSRARDLEAFTQGVRNAVRNAEWVRIAMEKQREEVKKTQQGQYVSRRLGLVGVQDKVVKHNRDQERVISSGFGSLDHLRNEAADLMEVARHFRTANAKGQRGEEENELLSMMAEMGIESPVTKESTGGNVRTYREQLARQLAGFLRKPILDLGGIMTLTDAYCLVMRNRASTELVSPEDFRIACGFFKRLGLAIEEVRLESGVAALKLDASRDTSGAVALRELAEERRSVTPIDIVRIRHVPIQRATSMLEDAEKAGFLARDSTTEGLRFFPNLFDSFTLQTIESVK